jgi:putative oxidoreductase
MNKLMNRLHNPDLGILFIRIALAAVFINAGWFKVNNIDMVVTGFASMGFSSFLAYLVAYAEFLGGILLLLGILARYTGVVIAIIMFVAMTKVHFANGFSLANKGYEYVLVLMLCALAIVVLGAGKYSLTSLFKKKVI